METLYLLFTLMCPLSMVGLVAWWAWSMRTSSGDGAGQKAPTRSTTEEHELARMRAHLDQMEAQAREGTAEARRQPLA